MKKLILLFLAFSIALSLSSNYAKAWQWDNTSFRNRLPINISNPDISLAIYDGYTADLTYNKAFLTGMDNDGNSTRVYCKGSQRDRINLTSWAGVITIRFMMTGFNVSTNSYSDTDGCYLYYNNVTTIDTPSSNLTKIYVAYADFDGINAVSDLSNFYTAQAAGNPNLTLSANGLNISTEAGNSNQVTVFYSPFRVFTSDTPFNVTLQINSYNGIAGRFVKLLWENRTYAQGSPSVYDAYDNYSYSQCTQGMLFQSNNVINGTSDFNSDGIFCKDFVNKYENISMVYNTTNITFTDNNTVIRVKNARGTKANSSIAIGVQSQTNAIIDNFTVKVLSPQGVTIGVDSTREESYAPAQQFIIYAKDENGNTISSYTATLINASTTSNSTSNGNLTININNGTAYTLTINASGYGTRSYSLLSAQFGSYTVYLPASTSTLHSVAIRTATLTGSAMTGIRITVQKLIGTVYVNVSTATTDDTGIASFLMDSTISYRLVINFISGTKTFSIMPVENQYVFYETGLQGQYSSIYQDITWQIRPSTNVLANNASQTVNITIYSQSHSLLNGTQTIATFQGNTYIVNATVASDGSKANATLILDLSAAVQGNTVITQFWINSSNANIGYTILDSRTYSIITPPLYANLTLEQILKDTAATSGLDIKVLSIIALLITTFVTGLIYSRFSSQGFVIVIVFVGILGVFTYAGWFDAYLWVILAILAGLVYYYYGGMS